MTEEKVQPKDKKIKRQRSTAYPQIPLKEAVEYSAELLKNYASSGFDRESAAEIMGHSTLSGPAACKVAALVHFGLIERKGSAYKIADLTKRICNPLDEREKQEALLEAVNAPKLFMTLIEEYGGKAVPPALNHVVSRNHGINPKVADKVVQLFKDSTEFAGVYENGILKSMNGKDLEGSDETVSEKGETLAPEQVQTEPGRKHRMVDAILPSGAVVSYPRDIDFQMRTSDEFTKTLASLEDIVKKALDNK